MVENFEALKTTAMGHGLRIPTFTEVYTPVVLNQAGFRSSEIRQRDSSALWANHALETGRLHVSIPSTSTTPELFKRHIYGGSPPPHRPEGGVRFRDRLAVRREWGGEIPTLRVIAVGAPSAQIELPFPEFEAPKS